MIGYMLVQCLVFEFDMLLVIIVLMWIKVLVDDFVFFELEKFIGFVYLLEE